MSGDCGGQGIGTMCGNLAESGWLILSQKAIPHNARVLAQSLFYKQLTEKRKDGRLYHLWAAWNFQSFTVICRKPHMASSNFLGATIFQNPEGTLWPHCISIFAILLNLWPRPARSVHTENSEEDATHTRKSRPKTETQMGLWKSTRIPNKPQQNPSSTQITQNEAIQAEPLNKLKPQ
jgi:hypothetical protein